MTDSEIQRLLHAIHALMRAVERALMTDTTEGVGDAMVTNYTKLHAKIAESYTDDYYVTDVLALEVPKNATDEQKVALVRLAATQLESYLQSLLEDQEADDFWGGNPPPGFTRRHRRRRSRSRGPERDFGAEISDEILNFTKETLRRALSGLDIDLDDDAPEPPEPPRPPKPPKRKPPVEPDDDVI